MRHSLPRFRGRFVCQTRKPAEVQSESPKPHRKSNIQNLWLACSQKSCTDLPPETLRCGIGGTWLQHVGDMRLFGGSKLSIRTQRRRHRYHQGSSLMAKLLRIPQNFR